MDLKHFAAKFTSLALIAWGAFQVLLSFNAIFFIYPHLNPRGGGAFFIQEGLIEKALTLYASMVASGLYGFLLLFKPEEKVKIVHILFGVLILAGSVFFTIQ